MKITVPEIPTELAGALSLRWLVGKDETVTKGQPIFQLENDTLSLEVAAPIAGVLADRQVATGAQVSPGDEVCGLEPSRLRDTSDSATTPTSAPGDPSSPELTGPLADAPFVDSKGERAIYQALGEAIRSTIQNNVQQFVAPENVQHLYHGEAWVHNVDTADPEPGQFTEHMVELEVKFQDIADNDFSVLPRYIHDTAEGMTSQTVSELFSVVAKSTEKSGNNVSVKEEGSFKQAFLRMLETIEFSVGRDGQVQRPEMHLSPQMYEQILPELQQEDETFRQQVDAITKEKEQQALQAEADRLAKFATGQES